MSWMLSISGVMGEAASLIPLLAVGLVPQDQPEPEAGVSVQLDVAAWYCMPSGWLSITRGSRPGTATTMNVGDEFDLNRKFEPTVDLAVTLGGHHGAGVRFRTLSLSGTGVDDDSFIYHGETFDAGRVVRAEASFMLLDAEYRYTFNPGDPLRVTGHIGAEYWRFDSRLQTVDDALPAIDTSRGFDSAFWMAGLTLSWSVTRALELHVFLAGGAERSHQYFFETVLRLGVQVVDHVRLTGAYEFHTLHFRQSTNLSGMNFQGPSLGVEVRF